MVSGREKGWGELTLDMQTIINAGAAVFLGAIGWVAREIWGAMKELRADLHKLEIDLPSNYIRKDEFAEGMKEIKEMLGRIFDRLDNKADRS